MIIKILIPIYILPPPIQGGCVINLLSRGFALLHLWLLTFAPFGANEEKVRPFIKYTLFIRSVLGTARST